MILMKKWLQILFIAKVFYKTNRKIIHIPAYAEKISRGYALNCVQQILLKYSMGKEKIFIFTLFHSALFEFLRTRGMILSLSKFFSLNTQLFYLTFYNFYNMDLPLILVLAGFFCLLNSLTLSHPSIQPCILSHLTLRKSPQILKIMFHQELLSVKLKNILP